MSAKNVDKHNRWRSRNISFRMSPEEAAQLDMNVKLSGLSKQDYITQCLLEREVKVYGNPRVHKMLRDQMEEVLAELHRIEAGGHITEHTAETIRMIATIMDGLKGELNGMRK